MDTTRAASLDSDQNGSDGVMVVECVANIRWGLSSAGPEAQRLQDREYRVRRKRAQINCHRFLW